MNQKSHKDKISILIEFFLKKPVQLDAVQFKKEAIAGSKLIKKFPDFDFFYDLPELVNKFNSLFGLLMKKNIQELDKKYKSFCYIRDNKPKQYVLEESAVIEIKLDKSKSRNVLEFLQNS